MRRDSLPSRLVQACVWRIFHWIWILPLLILAKMSDLFIGIDSGTQSTKAVVLDGGTGRVLGSASVSYGFLSGLKDGAKEQNPSVWVAALEKSVRSVIKKTGVNVSRIKGMGVSAQQHGFVALDEKDQVIRPAKLWCDTSTHEEAAALVKGFGGAKRLIAMAGNSIPAGYTASKILWLKNRESKNYQRLATVLLPHDYLNFYLTGEKTMEAGDASGTGLLDIKTRDWHPRLIAAIDPRLRDKLPEIRSSSLRAGGLAAAASRRLGLPREMLVSAGGGDNMMAAIGTGNTKPGMVTVSLGTSGTISAYASRPILDSRGEVAAFCDSTGAWLPLLCTMNATSATELVKGAFGFDNDALTRAAAAIPAGAEGLRLLPYFAGERVPDLPLGKGVYYGLDGGNFTPAHFARATMEGVSMSLAYGFNRLQDLGIRPKQIRITGGGSQNPLWRQILADAFNTEVVGLVSSEGAAYGAALQACWCYRLELGERLRIQQLTDSMVKTESESRCAPVKGDVKKYRILMNFYEEMIHANSPLFTSKHILK